MNRLRLVLTSGWVAALLTLPLSIAGAETLTASFRNGDDGYDGIEDTVVRRDAGRVEWNNGASLALQIHGQADDYYPYKAALVKFNDVFGNGMGQVPLGHNLISATFRMYLYLESVGGGTGKTLLANPLLVEVPDFGTSDGAAKLGEVTFKDRAHGQLDWGPPINDGLVKDVDYDSTLTASLSYETADVDSFIELDITNIVSEWYAGTREDHGLFIRPGNDQTASYFRSSEYEPVGDRPQLVIQYSLAACGDVNHPYPMGDYNQDCNVDLMDVVFLAQHWMDCTDPDPPCNFVP